MEVQLALGTREYQNNVTLKGKRTKRRRQVSSMTLTVASGTASSIISGGSYSSGALSKATTSLSGGSTVEQYEEEETANCLILLAQGGYEYKVNAAAYECKTCNRSFPSFQALGGHRTSHKKEKGAEEERLKKKKKPLLLLEEDRFLHDYTELSLQIVPNGFDLSAGKGGGSIRVHECALCGAEFSSGQALGGHMRRHRTPSMAAAAASNAPSRQESTKIPENGVLGLDLNLPAVEESKLSIAWNEQVIVFSSAASLVECRY